MGQIPEKNLSEEAFSQKEHLVVGISSRALFDLKESNDVFEREGLDAYRHFQIEHEDDVLEPGSAFPLVTKLLAFNKLSANVPPVEVILLSRNSGDTSLRIFNSIQHYGLSISRAALTSGAPTSDYVRPFNVDLFLSTNGEDVARALRAGIAAATVMPSTSLSRSGEQLRIAFDGDAVIFGDESERVSREQGLDAFHKNESERALEPLSVGPFGNFLHAVHHLQVAYPAEQSPIRTALVTARSAPAHKRVILTLRQWGVRIDEALFLGGRDKGPFLEAFGADIFFDDSPTNVESARRHVTTGYVPSSLDEGKDYP